MPNWEPPDEDRSCAPFMCSCASCVEERAEQERRSEESARRWKTFGEREGINVDTGTDEGLGNLWELLTGQRASAVACGRCGCEFIPLNMRAAVCPSCGSPELVRGRYPVSITRLDLPK